jgi:Mg-chelatase subunit ChlD
MKAHIARIAGVSTAALRQLMQGDRVGIMTFAIRSQLVLPLTSDLDAAAEAIRERVLKGKIGGGTRILAGVHAAAGEFLSGPRERRRAVLVITDNEGQKSRREGTVVRALWEADATLSAVVVPPRLNAALRWYVRIAAPQTMLLQERIGEVAQKTGGDAIRSEDPASAFTEMIGRIRRRYCLYYRQPESKPGETRSIQVELAGEAKEKMPKARVLSRYGYLVPGSP